MELSTSEYVIPKMLNDTMQVMAEVKPRSFDLKSWQGLTDVLKAARESNLDSASYNEFRNLVLQYAQQKGSDAQLKSKIDAIIGSFGVKKTALSEEVPESAAPHAEAPKTAPQHHGRRVVPNFVPKKDRIPTPIVPTPPVPNGESAREPAVKSAPEAVIPPTVPEPVKTLSKAEPEAAPQPLKSIEEHRTRIMEVKRRVNALVGNPVTLIDHGNSVGREYMTALLSALKATSPGSSLNVEEAMARLEASFEKILAIDSKDAPEGEKDAMPATSAKEEAASPVAEPLPQEDESVPQEVIPAVAEEVAAVSPTPIEKEESMPAIPAEEQANVENEKTHESLPQTEAANDERRWSEEGGDSTIQAQIKALREELKARDEAAQPQLPPRERPLIPSIVDLEEESIPLPVEETALPGDTVPVVEDELSTHSLTHRSLSSMTGITLGTPQAELMTPEVTGLLTELLHDWGIFASSGIFGMGPSGIEHPLYEKLARLPMGEVLSGRFENADMKLVRNIKDYVDAWRHEQGVSYNQTETFEHYLRRVSLRILKRQSPGKTV